MQGKNHVALALAIPLAVSALAGGPLPVSVAGWGGLIIGSLAPDLDGGGSVAYIGNFLPRHITPKPLIALLNGIGKTISDVIRSVFGHRKALHWPSWGLFIMAAGYLTTGYWLLTSELLLWFGAGYILHILGDSLTKSGVPLLGPLSTQDISFIPMVTGKFTESAFGWLLWAFVGWQICSLLPYDQWLWQLVYRFSPELLPR